MDANYMVVVRISKVIVLSLRTHVGSQHTLPTGHKHPRLSVEYHIHSRSIQRHRVQCLKRLKIRRQILTRHHWSRTVTLGD